MSKKERFARIIHKRTSIPGLSATTAPSNDHTLSPQWEESDIYKGEFYINLEDENLWIRTDHRIRRVLFEGDVSISGGTGTDLYVTDGYYDAGASTLYLNRQDAQVIITGLTSGGSGTSGSSGSSGTSGTDGTSGSSGTDGTSGSSGTDGTSGSSGTSGIDGSTTLSGLTDTTINDPTTGESLVYSGGTWVNAFISGGTSQPGAISLTGLTDVDFPTSPQDNQVLTYQSGSWVNLNASGVTGAYGGNSMLYDYLSGTSMTDPGTGYFRLNNSDPGSSTQTSISTTNKYGVFIQDWLRSIDTNGSSFFRYFKEDDPSIFVVHRIGNVTDNGSYFNFNLTPVESNGTFTNEDNIVITYTEGGAGTDGTSGSSGTDGTSGSSGTSGIDGSTTLSGLTDTTINNIQEGDLLIFTGGTWVNISGYTSGGGSTTLSGLTDTTINYPLTGHTLIFSGGTWVNMEGIIGTAEDGTYLDGLFTDFETDTSIGIAIDRFNEVLKALAPPPAPTLTSSSTILGGTVQASSGKISFGVDNEISGYYPSGETVGTSYYLSAGNGNETGVLADNISAHSYSYDANAFSNTGTITVRSTYSGVTLSHSVDLDVISGSTYNQTISGITISLSAIKYCQFLDTTPFLLFEYRTGTWSVVSTNFNDGVNFVEVEYEASSIGSDNFAVDSDTTATVISTPVLDTLVMAGSKYLSGVEYYTSGTALYDCVIQNAYRNTYHNSGTISFTGTRCSVPSTTISDVSGLNAHLTDITITNRTATINVTRLLDQNIGVSINTVNRTLARDDTPTNTTQYINNILLDNVADNSTNTTEYINGEDYRLKNNSYTTTSDITGITNAWDSQDNLTGVTGLQVYGGNLVFPSINFSTIANGPTGNPDYTSITGAQTYLRKFNLGTGVSNMVLVINGSGTGTFKALSDSTGNYIHVEVMSGLSPGPGLTSWKDGYLDYPGGAYGATYGSSRSFGGNWGITFGTNGTSYSSGYVLLRITTNATITVSSITLNAYV